MSLELSNAQVVLLNITKDIVTLNIIEANYEHVIKINGKCVSQSNCKTPNCSYSFKFQTFSDIKLNNSRIGFHCKLLDCNFKITCSNSSIRIVGESSGIDKKIGTVIMLRSYVTFQDCNLKKINVKNRWVDEYYHYSFLVDGGIINEINYYGDNSGFHIEPHASEILFVECGGKCRNIIGYNDSDSCITKIIIHSAGIDNYCLISCQKCKLLEIDKDSENVVNIRGGGIKEIKIVKPMFNNYILKNCFSDVYIAN